MHEVADFVVLGGAEAGDPAGSAVRAPERCVYATVAIQRCDQLIAVTAAAGRVTWLACKLEPDAAELARELH